MAILPEQDRHRTFAQIIRDIDWDDLTKPDIRAAIDAVDNWAESNAASYNTALPQPFRSQATVAQKALILAYVCMRRAGILKAEEDN